MLKNFLKEGSFHGVVPEQTTDEDFKQFLDYKLNCLPRPEMNKNLMILGLKPEI
jgi:hypothetical protein